MFAYLLLECTKNIGFCLHFQQWHLETIWSYCRVLKSKRASKFIIELPKATFISLCRYKRINPQIAEIAKQKLEHHLWYLGEELVGLSFFDRSLSVDTHKKMAESIKNNPGNEKTMKKATCKASYLSANLYDFVTINTQFFFKKLKISTDFLMLDPSEWINNRDYVSGLQIVTQLNVINDSAERSVALITDYNKSITSNEEQKQYLLQVVDNHRKNLQKFSKNKVLRIYFFIFFYFCGPKNVQHYIPLERPIFAQKYKNSNFFLLIQKNKKN